LNTDTFDRSTAPAQAGDEALARLAARDTDAFTELYRRYAQRVYRYLLARTGDVDDAQELTAETFLAAAQGIARFRGQSLFSTWLLGIARHKATDHFRRRRVTVPLDEASELPEPETGRDEALIREMQLEQLRRALPGLSAERAEAISLHVFAKLSVAEVAQVMQKNEPAVRMLIHRAVRDLRERLAAYGAEAEHEAS
jgi:RNA polymerase sigma-70 factor (ECF subfamily)